MPKYIVRVCQRNYLILVHDSVAITEMLIRNMCCFGFISTLLILQSKNIVVMGADYIDPETSRLLAQYACYKLHSCTPGRPPVCGFSAANHYLVLFNDECVMLDVNCKGNGRYMFLAVEKAICDAKLKYEKEHKGEEFRFDPIVKKRVTSPTPTVTATKKHHFMKGVWKMKQRTGKHSRRRNLRLRRIFK